MRIKKNYNCSNCNFLTKHILKKTRDYDSTQTGYKIVGFNMICMVCNKTTGSHMGLIQWNELSSDNKSLDIFI